MSEKKLYLIDGNSLLYRSFYAIQHLSTAQGFPTNAIYGFITTLRKLIDRDKPGWLGVVFDAPGRNLRHDLYEDYKAHRKPMPDDLAAQIPKLKEVIGALRIPVFVHPGYEADDVLGTLARRAAPCGFQTVIVTTDKDLLQLVDGVTFVYNPSKDILLDEAKVREVFGAKPSQVADILALWGDASDNIPGVPGIGEKTAKSLIEEFGSIDNILKDPAKIRNPRIREKLAENRDKLDMSRKLVAIETDLPLEFEPDRFILGEPDREAAGRLFRELEFTSLANEYGKAAAPSGEGRVYAAIFEEKELKALAARIRKAGFVSLDTETDNIFPTRARLVGMSFALEPGKAFYLPLRHDYLGAPPQISVERALGILRGVLEDPAVRKIGDRKSVV
jgi:DNA polymerase I